MDEPSQPGWLLGARYRVVDRIGAGGTAEVFRACDEVLNRDVAVKVFRTLVDPSDSCSGADRQEAELRALAQLNHPNLITLFDGSITEGKDPPFVVMELVDGTSLAQRIAAGPLPEPEARDIGAQIATALAFVHSREMVHRDVKPANILLASDGVSGVRAQLSDFGIVRIVGTERITGANLALGTPQYLAPEQARGADVGPAADVYALGLVLLEMLTGRRPQSGVPVETVLTRMLTPPQIPRDLPAPWPQLLRAMTAADPSLRPPAVEVARMLRAVPDATNPVAAGLTAAPPLVAGPEPETPAEVTTALAAPDEVAARTHPHRAGLLVLALVLAAVVGFGGYLLTHRPASSGPPGRVVTTGPPGRRHSHAPTSLRSSSNPAVQPADRTHALSTSPRRHLRRTHAASRPSSPTSRAPTTSGAPSTSPSSSPPPSSSTVPRTSSTPPPPTTSPPPSPTSSSGGGG